MRVEIGLPEPIAASSSSSSDSSSSSSLNNESPQIYLEGLKGYPDERCHPEINGSLAIFRLSLTDFYECGVTRMVNQLTVCRTPQLVVYTIIRHGSWVLVFIFYHSKHFFFIFVLAGQKSLLSQNHNSIVEWQRNCQR